MHLPTSTSPIGLSSLGIYQSETIHNYNDYLFAFPEHKPRTLDTKKIGDLEVIDLSCHIDRDLLDPKYSFGSMRIEQETYEVECEGKMDHRDIMALNTLIDQRRIFGNNSQTIIFQFGTFITDIYLLYNGFIKDFTWSGNFKRSIVFLKFLGYRLEQVHLKPLTKRNLFDIEISDEKEFFGTETDIEIYP